MTNPPKQALASGRRRRERAVPTPDANVFNLELEDGNDFLQENDAFILLEAIA